MRHGWGHRNPSTLWGWQYGDSSRNYTSRSLQAAIQLLGIYPEDTLEHVPDVCSALFVRSKHLKQPKCPLQGG